MADHSKSKRKFYRTVVEVEILSEEPIAFENLEEVAHETIHGDWSGSCKETVSNEEVDGPAMAELLRSHGSDPGFFQLTDDGEDEETE